jgi:hypothetical protein
MESCRGALDLEGGTPEAETQRRSGGKCDKSGYSNHSGTVLFIPKYTEYLSIARTAGLKLTYIAIS